jgi:hypothetical protein
MADKFLTTDETTGGACEVEATTVSTGVAEAGDVVALNASGQVDPSMLPNVDSLTATSGEALTAGDIVYIDAAGEVVKASGASGGNEGQGYVLDSVATATAVTIYFEGRNTALSGLTVGARYFLSDTTAGGLTTTPPADTGELFQYIGRAVSATAIAFEPDRPIKRA